MPTAVLPRVDIASPRSSQPGAALIESAKKYSALPDISHDDVAFLTSVDEALRDTHNFPPADVAASVTLMRHRLLFDRDCGTSEDDAARSLASHLAELLEAHENGARGLLQRERGRVSRGFVYRSASWVQSFVGRHARMY